MKKSLVILVLVVLFCLCGCEAVSPILKETESVGVLEKTAETESTDELAATIKSSVEIDQPETENTGSMSSTDEDSSTKAVQEMKEDKLKEELQSSESEIAPSIEPVDKPSASEPHEEKQQDPAKPSEAPKETEQPKSTEPPAPPATTEPSAPAVVEPPVETQPKTAYDYEFDIGAIRSDCISIGQNMGYSLNTSLTPQNATWWNPVTASESNQGSTLKSNLEQYIRFHTLGNLSAYGLDEITEFNICCESRGGGAYAIYFVFA